jgi:hypothetical protein
MMDDQEGRKVEGRGGEGRVKIATLKAAPTDPVTRAQIVSTQPQTRTSQPSQQKGLRQQMHANNYLEGNVCFIFLHDLFQANFATMNTYRGTHNIRGEVGVDILVTCPL